MEYPLRTRSVVDAVEEAVRRLIVSGEEPQGAVVTEVGVAARFGVGRPTAKAAIDRLVGDGMLSRDGRRGAVVPLLDADDVTDLYDSRLVIERHVHARLAEVGTVPAEATTANAALRHAASADDAARVVAADVAFHRALVGADVSRRLQRMHAMLMAEAHVCMARVQTHQLLKAETIADEHAEILRRIENGDAAGADAATRSHLHNARDTVLRSLFRDRGDPGPPTAHATS